MASLSEKFMFYEKVALIADRATATFYRLAGLKNIFIVEREEEAETCLQTVSNDPNLLIVLITGPIVNKFQAMIERVTSEKYPVFIPIQDVEGRVIAKTDFINNFIKHKVGIEFKLE